MYYYVEVNYPGGLYPQADERLRKIAGSDENASGFGFTSGERDICWRFGNRRDRAIALFTRFTKIHWLTGVLLRKMEE